MVSACARTTLATPTATPAPPVLGQAVGDFFGGSGFGQVRPALIDNGGDPTGRFTNIVWASWGGPRAIGSTRRSTRTSAPGGTSRLWQRRKAVPTTRDLAASSPSTPTPTSTPNYVSDTAIAERITLHAGDLSSPWRLVQDLPASQHELATFNGFPLCNYSASRVPVSAEVVSKFDDTATGGRLDSSIALAMSSADIDAQFAANTDAFALACYGSGLPPLLPALADPRSFVVVSHHRLTLDPSYRGIALEMVGQYSQEGARQAITLDEFALFRGRACPTRPIR